LKDNAGSFEEIVMPHLGTVYRAAIAMCGNREDAEDLAQATFLKAFERFETFKKGTNCKAWLLSILRNKWIDLIRHRSTIGQVVQIDENLIVRQEQIDELNYSNCEDLLANFSDGQVIKALRSLPDEQRLILFLIDVEQLRQEDVAEIMDVPVGTVKSRTSRARAILKTRLFSYAKEMGFIGGER
jgi:RNA polymerase sigma-70 factor (ECF subfamily)